MHANPSLGERKGRDESHPIVLKTGWRSGLSLIAPSLLRKVRLQASSYSSFLERLAHKTQLSELVDLVPGRRGILELQVLGVLQHLRFQHLDFLCHLRR